MVMVFHVPTRLLTDSKSIFNSFSAHVVSPTIQNMTQINMQKTTANFTEWSIVSKIFTSHVQCELLRQLKTVLDTRSKTEINCDNAQ